MFTGVLTKVIELEDAVHPENRPVGEETKGEFLELPVVGDRFIIMSGLTRGLTTSPVIDIISEDGNETLFKTLNSIYRLVFVFTE